MGKRGDTNIMNENNNVGFNSLVYLKADTGNGCQYCTDLDSESDLHEQINHYTEEHDYKLLHIGAEVNRDNKGELFNVELAVLAMILI